MTRDCWLRFSKAIYHYENHGFTYEVMPWTAPDEVIEITKPPEAHHFRLGNDALVGSAEQSFLSQYDYIDNKPYYSITPCFRDERQTFFNQPYFMKLELFSKDTSKFIDILVAAWTFFLSQVPNPSYLRLEDINEHNKDITYNGIELGSYYKAKYQDKEWVCGTGLAEPRFDRAILFS